VGLATTYSSSGTELNGYKLSNCNLCCEAPAIGVSGGGSFEIEVTGQVVMTFDSDEAATAFSNAFSSSSSPEKTAVIAAFAAEMGVDVDKVTVVLTSSGTAVTLDFTVTVEASTSSGVDALADGIASVMETVGGNPAEVIQSITSEIENAGGGSYSFSLEVGDWTKGVIVTVDPPPSDGSVGGDGNVATQATLSYVILSTMLSLLSLHHWL